MIRAKQLCAAMVLSACVWLPHAGALTTLAFDVTGTFSNGYTVSGTIDLSPTYGAPTVDLTVTQPAGSQAPVQNAYFYSTTAGDVYTLEADNPPTDDYPFVVLQFAVPTSNVANYTGGPLSPEDSSPTTFVAPFPYSELIEEYGKYGLVSGELTPASASTPPSGPSTPSAVPLPAAAWSAMTLLAGLGLLSGWNNLRTKRSLVRR